MGRDPVRSFETCLFATYYGGDWELDVRIEYTVCPADPKSGVTEPSPENIRAYDQDTGEELSEDEYDSFQLELREACFEHMASGDEPDPYDGHRSHADRVDDCRLRETYLEGAE